MNKLESLKTPTTKLVNKMIEDKDKENKDIRREGSPDLDSNNNEITHGVFGVLPFTNNNNDEIRSIGTLAVLSLNEEAPEKFGLSTRLNYFDFALADIVYSFAKAGYKEFSLADVVSLMTGSDNPWAYKELSEFISKELEKCAPIRCRIDCTDELRQRMKSNKTLPIKIRRWKKNTRIIIDSYFLCIKSVEERSDDGSIIQKYYRIMDYPALHEYSDLVGQMTEIPVTLLSGAKSSDRHFTRDELLIRTYIIKRIQAMKNPRNKIFTRTISLDPSKHYKDGELKESPGALAFSNKRSKLVKIFETVLNDLVEAGEINGFAPNVGKNRSITGFDIDLNISHVSISEDGEIECS